MNKQEKIERLLKQEPTLNERHRRERDKVIKLLALANEQLKNRS